MIKTQLPFSVTNREVKEAANHFAHQVLSSGQHGDQILTAVKQFSNCVLLQSFAAAYYLFGQTHETTISAKAHLKRAEKYLTKSNLRERLWYQAILAWSEINYELAISILMAIAQQWPTDVLAIKLTEWLCYCTGQVSTAQRMLTLHREVCAATAAVNFASS